MNAVCVCDSARHTTTEIRISTVLFICGHQSLATIKVMRACASVRSQMHNKYNVITWCDGFAVCNQRNLNPFKSSSSHKRYDNTQQMNTKCESIGRYELWSSYCMVFSNSSNNATHGCTRPIVNVGIMCALDDVNLIYFIDIIRLSCASAQHTS